MSDFNPNEHLVNLKGKAYLEVKFRLLWLREDAPDSQIRTEHVMLNENIAVFHAIATRIVDGEVKGVGEGYGSETPRDFGDYIEKAETKAIGRALGALGYGTQFCDDHEFGASQGRVVDAPVARKTPPPAERRQNLPTKPPNTPDGLGFAPQGQNRPQAGPGDITDKQKGMLRALSSKKNPDKNTTPDEFLHQQMYFRFKKMHLDDLTRREASELIDAIDTGDVRDGVMPPPVREDTTERHQREPSFGGMAGPVLQEPAHLAAAPDLGEPGNDRWS
jgi:hypothetical protein